MRRRMTTGYQVPTLLRRIDELTGEVRLMGVDGRLARKDAQEIEMLLGKAAVVCATARHNHRKGEGK